ncbi:MAG: hypothetical protein OEU26_18665 [Candidatus Tectomicrobia bacterium]|nr:hypothetical protein [Candidatus Tectomicrobia bacterium]
MVQTMRLASLGFILVLLCGDARASAVVEVLEVALAASVVEREPDRKFSPPGHCSESGTDRPPRIDPTQHPSIVLWTRVKAATPLVLAHTYYRAFPQETQETAWQGARTVTLPVSISPSWRTWSQKTLAWDTGHMLRGTLKVEVTASAVPDAVLCTVYFFVLEDAIWQALTEEQHVQDTLCRIAKTLPPESLFRAGREVLDSRAGTAEDATTPQKLLAGWKHFTQHATASHQLFCAESD